MSLKILLNLFVNKRRRKYIEENKKLKKDKTELEENLKKLLVENANLVSIIKQKSRRDRQFPH